MMKAHIAAKAAPKPASQRSRFSRPRSRSSWSEFRESNESSLESIEPSFSLITSKDTGLTPNACINAVERLHGVCGRLTLRLGHVRNHVAGVEVRVSKATLTVEL